jgi:hypothetical protein
MLAGVPQGPVLGSTLFLNFINNIPEHAPAQLSLVVDDTAAVARGWYQQRAIRPHQQHVQKPENWMTK